MRCISIEDYLFKWVFWPDRFFTTGFFVAGDVLLQCNFSFRFLLCYFPLCCNLYFTSWVFLLLAFVGLPSSVFMDKFLVCHFFDACKLLY